VAGEFNLIYQHIAPQAGSRGDIVLGIGDDAAVIASQHGSQLVVALDTLVAGRHFFIDQDAADIAYKSLAVNLSDLAAMGAVPKWALLSLALPKNCANASWIASFMSGWSLLAQAYSVALVGGDTTRSDTLTISVTLMGEIASGQAITRSGANQGDDIWVTGTIGDAGLALVQLLAGQQPEITISQRLHRPNARVVLGKHLVQVASAAIDISDGLLADLSHLLKASNVGAVLALEEIPFSDAVQSWIERSGWENPLTSGDDYELLFTAPPNYRDTIFKLAQQTNTPVCHIGAIVDVNNGLKIQKKGQLLVLPTRKGFDHFDTTDYNESS
jgi:thiamine-monophosphate kinase